MRHSHIVYTLIRLPTAGGPSLLLLRHKKWGDWSLVGGHVEVDEMDDWGLAATREANEELEPLVDERDFVVEPLHDEPITWGPEASRSARGERTIYHIRYYSLVFRRDPVQLLAQLPAEDFLVLPEQELSTTTHALGNPIHRVRRYLRGGFDSVPMAWGETIDPQVLPAGLHAVTGHPSGPRVPDPPR